MTTSRHIIRITASSTAQPLASPLSSERSPTALAITFLYHSCPRVHVQVFNGLDGHSSGSTSRHPNCHPPMSEKSHCPNISPRHGCNRRPVVPKLRVPTQRHPSWGILEKSRIGLPSPTITVSIHHLPQPMSHSPPPVTHSPTFLPLPAPHSIHSDTYRLGLQPPRCRWPPTERESARRTHRPPERRGRERSKEREHRKGKVGLR